MASTQPRHNLPLRDYARFVGRQRELAELRRLLLPHPRSRHHLITVDGIGGIGKTALALESGYTYIDNYASMPDAERFDGIVWVSAKRTYLTSRGVEHGQQRLAGLGDLLAAIAEVLDYPAITRAVASEQRALAELALSETRTLLLLDNLETVDDQELLDFLRDLPEPTKAIVTTRHRIDSARPLRLTAMPEADAMELIAQTSASKEISLTQLEHEQLWLRTGGVPLAIVWSIGLMAEGGRAEDVMRRLSQGQSDITRFCFAESVTHIQGRDSFWLLLALSLFATDAGREALGMVAGLEDDSFGRDTGLDELIRLSLINKEGDRFSVLQLTRSFVQDLIREHTAWLEGAQERLVVYYNQLTRERGGWTMDWEGQALNERELPNLMLVVDTLQARLHYDERPDQLSKLTTDSVPVAQQLCRLARRVARTCRIRGLWSAAEQLCQLIITVAREIGDRDDVGHRYWDLARISLTRGDETAAEELLQLALAELEQVQNAGTIARVTSTLGVIALRRGDVARARQLTNDGLAAYLARGNDYAQADLFCNAAAVALHEGEAASAESMYRQAGDITRASGDLTRLTVALLGLGSAYQSQGNTGGAMVAYLDSLKTAEESGRADSIVRASLKIAQLHAQAGAADQARPLAARALELSRRLGMRVEHEEAEDLLQRLSSSLS